MRPATARYISFFCTAWLAALMVRSNEYPLWLGICAGTVLAALIAAGARYGWRDAAPAPSDDSPLPPDVLDLGTAKVGTKDGYENV